MDGGTGRSRSDAGGREGGSADGARLHRPRHEGRGEIRRSAQGQESDRPQRRRTQDARQTDEGRCPGVEGQPRRLGLPSRGGRGRGNAERRLERLRRCGRRRSGRGRSEEHTYEIQSLMPISYAVFCLNKKKYITKTTNLKIIHINTTQKHTIITNTINIQPA